MTRRGKLSREAGLKNRKSNQLTKRSGYIFLRKNKNEIFINHLLGTHREIPHRVKGQVKNKFDDLVLSFFHQQIGAGMDLKHKYFWPQALLKHWKNSNKDKIGVTFFFSKMKNKTKFKIHDHLYFHQRWKMAHIVQLIFYQIFRATAFFAYCVTRAPLLYFIRSSVALSFKVCPWVSEFVRHR